MLKLYISKGSSALASHILLEETGASYTTEDISIAQGKTRAPEFLSINPKGRVPALQTPEGVITENPAILEYLAATHPDKNLRPQTPFAQAQARALCAFLCATAHVGFSHGSRPQRWADDADAQAAMRRKVKQNLSDYAAYLETLIHPGAWALGETYSYCDPYVFLMGRWLEKSDLDVQHHPILAAHSAAMRARPATQTVLAAHDLV